MKILSDELYADMGSQILWLRQLSEEKDRTIASLTAQIVEMKRDGFARPTPQMAQSVPIVVDDRIMAAIRTVAQEGSRLEGELMAFANAQLLADEEIEDVADRILAGASFGDDE